MPEYKPSQKINILLRGFGQLHANIKDYLADDITVKVWADKRKFAKQTNAPLTHDINTFYRELQMQKKTSTLSIDYQYRKEFRSIYKELMKHSSALLNTYDLIEKCEFCATITGTAGFEALTFGKRVLIFGQVIYKDFPGVIQYTDNLTFEDITSVHFSHTELELAYAKLVRGMVNMTVDRHYVQRVKNFSMGKNTQPLADIIRQSVRE